MKESLTVRSSLLMFNLYPTSLDLHICHFYVVTSRCGISAPGHFTSPCLHIRKLKWVGVNAWLGLYWFHLMISRDVYSEKDSCRRAHNKRG